MYLSLLTRINELRRKYDTYELFLLGKLGLGRVNIELTNKFAMPVMYPYYTLSTCDRYLC